jgi:hypothetical protein
MHDWQLSFSAFQELIDGLAIHRRWLNTLLASYLFNRVL